MADTTVSALAAAWITTMIAMTLFVAGIAVSRAWNSQVYLQTLQDVLSEPLIDTEVTPDLASSK